MSVPRPFGLINLDKPAGMTSRDALNRVQRIAKPHKVGHAGTLDPLATGVLVVTVGAATRLTSLVQAWPKTYRGTFVLGQSSDTDDIQGNIVVDDAAVPVSRAALEAAATTFCGQITQRPPAYSAIRIGGKRAYKLARSGKAFDVPLRTVRVDAFRIERFEYPEFDVYIECGSGTYVRSLGRDLAASVGTSALMSRLRREAIGPFEVESAVAPEQLTPDNWLDYLQPAALTVRDLPHVVIRADERRAVLHAIPLDLPPSRWCQPHGIDATDNVVTHDWPQRAAIDEDGNLLALMTVGRDGRFQPTWNFIAGTT